MHFSLPKLTEMPKCVFLKFCVEPEIYLSGFCSMTEISRDTFVINDFSQNIYTQQGEAQKLFCNEDAGSPLG